MGLLEEIQRMRQSGMRDDQIVLKLQEQGNSYRAISEAISQSKIKQAVEATEQEPLPPIPSEIQQQTPQNYQEQETQQYPREQNMQQSIMPQQQIQQEIVPTQEYFPGYESQEQNIQQPQEDYTQTQSYDYSQSGLSSDTIMEISEQVVSEKLSDVRKKLENMSSFKTELETKTEAIEDRLKRIEKIIDTLQASVLRKVGDYVTNVEDIKKELIESQKTIARAMGSKHHSKEHKR
jgi:hypothetical protein